MIWIPLKIYKKKFKFISTEYFVVRKKYLVLMCSSNFVLEFLFWRLLCLKQIWLILIWFAFIHYIRFAFIFLFFSRLLIIFISAANPSWWLCWTFGYCFCCSIWIDNNFYPLHVWCYCYTWVFTVCKYTLWHALVWYAKLYAELHSYDISWNSTTTFVLWIWYCCFEFGKFCRGM